MVPSALQRRGPALPLREEGSSLQRKARFAKADEPRAKGGQEEQSSGGGGGGGGGFPAPASPLPPPTASCRTQQVPRGSAERGLLQPLAGDAGEAAGRLEQGTFPPSVAQTGRATGFSGTKMETPPSLSVSLICAIERSD
ncbi:Hypothetical predicted protein [Podarcis lilfordi]|uniref:Uncharacterized protein n=1 Tax=Podarcis lilfordi TaxID=74358 RepID=A0AA35L0U4_9SAUR|nr:Hypothetical predicted protein [Podarcis lilfordi]